jgi:site-specific recombinase XerD
MSAEEKHPASLGELAPKFLRFAEVELCFAQQSILKYKDCLRQVAKILGDRPVVSYTEDDVLELKAAMLRKNHSVGRQVSILAAVKRFVEFCRNREGLPALDPGLISVPKRPRREVVYLTAEEVDRFVDSIHIVNRDGKSCVDGLRFRAMVEALLGSAMRIGELLSLNRAEIDFERREARIIGKGNKQRTVFFTTRALQWIQKYLNARSGAHPALFVRQDGLSRLKQPDLWRPFARYRRVAGINKKVTPHLLRHTAATQLLFNGCPIGHIKEILGHERLETTCRYYLGLDHRAAKLAHERYLIYDPVNTAIPSTT